MKAAHRAFRLLGQLLLLTASADGHAQAYRPLLEQSATWSDVFYTSETWIPDLYYECYFYYLQGDTTVNDTGYSIMRMTGEYSDFNIDFNQLQVTHYNGIRFALVREDTIARRVFIRDPLWGTWGELGEATEYLLYDFSVDTGAYPPTFRYPSPLLHAAQMDSILLADGAHRRIVLTGGAQLVEGVGSLESFLPNQVYWPAPWGQNLTCQSRNGEDIYTTQSTDCGCTAVGITESSPMVHRIVPSPTAGPCNLEHAPIHASYRIHSLDGRSVRSGYWTDGSGAIDLTGLPSAIYVVELIVPDGTLNVRVVKE